MKKKRSSALFSLLNGDYVSSDETIIEKENFTKLLTITELQKEVAQRAEEYKKNVVKESEQVKKAAYDEGFKEGIDQFVSQVAALNKTCEAFKAKVNEKIIKFSVNAVEKILHKELALEPEAIERIVEEILKEVSQSYKVVIHLNEEDIPRVNEGKLKEILQQVKLFEIKPHKDLNAGECTINTEKEVIKLHFKDLLEKLEFVAEKFIKNIS